MFFCKKISKGDKIYELQIWDTAGQEKFRSITPLYFRDANGVILVCDLTSPSSFNSLRDWVKLLEEQGPKRLGRKRLIKAKIIVGNKVDMQDSIKVQEDDMKAFSDSLGAPYVLTSALTDEGIDQAFQKVIDKIEYVKSEMAGSLITGKQMKKKQKGKDGCAC